MVSKTGVSLKNYSNGDTYTTRGLYIHAVDEYEKILLENPNDKETMIKLARLYLWVSGVKDVTKSQELLTKLKSKGSSDFLRLQAEIDYQNEKFEQVKKVLKETAENKTLDPAGYQILAQTYLHNFEYEECIKYFSRAYYLSGEKLMDYSPITAHCLALDFDGAYITAKEMIYDGRRFFDSLDMIRSKDYPPKVLEEFRNMLTPLTKLPDESNESEFDKAYKDFSKLYPQHGELSELAFKLAFRRFQK